MARDISKGGKGREVSANTEGFTPLLGALRQRIADSRQQALRAVDVVQVQTYWHIGRHIVEFEQGGAQRAAYGRGLLAQLGQALTAEFGRGFDASNLRHMRGFYLAFPIRDALRRELSWTHYRLLLRVDSAEARQRYVRMYDDLRRGEGDNPTVGILLCGSKDQLVARYSVLNGSEQLFASKYRLVLPSEEELRLELQRDREEIEAHKLLRGESEKHD
jgi:hypothetical protein